MARNLVTANNLSPLVQILTWFLCIASVLSALGRAATKLIFSRTIKSDDYSSLSSLIVSIAQSAAVSVGTSNGLGKHVTKLDSTQISKFSRATYAANILYVVSLSLSELSVILFIALVTPVKLDRRLLFGTGCLTVLWAVVAVIVNLAECTSPSPWSYINGHCVDRIEWWNAIEVMNILINFMLIALPTWIIANLQVSMFKKVSAVLMFAIRTTVCVASMCKLVYGNRIRNSHDLTFDMWPVTVCTQAIQCLSIVSFNFLYLKPLFEILDSGFIRTDELRRRGQQSTSPDGGSYSLSRASQKTRGKRATRHSHTGNTDTVITALGRERGWDGESQDSEAQIIKEVRTFEIESSTPRQESVSTP